MSESTGHEYLKDHQLSGDVLSLDLKEESKAVLGEARKAGVGHAAKTLVKDGPLRVVIIGFTPGSSLREHRAGGPVSIQALAGSVEVSTEGRSDSLQAGNILVLAADLGHSVISASEAVLLLTIA